jgi:hypothetical protein
MKDYVLKEKPEPAANETVWAFDLGRASIGDSPSPRWGEGGRSPDEVNPIPQFLHKASLLIPAEFALPRGRECCACLRRPRSRVLPRGETKTAAGRRRMWRTHQAHKALIGAIKECHQTRWAGGKLSPLAAL